MKTNNHFLIALIALTFSLSSCNKNYDIKPSENENFSEYFTCKVNGVEFSPDATFYCINRNFSFYPAETAGQPANSLVIYGRD